MNNDNNNNKKNTHRYRFQTASKQEPDRPIECRFHTITLTAVNRIKPQNIPSAAVIAVIAILNNFYEIL